MEPFPSPTRSMPQSASDQLGTEDRCSAIGFARLVWSVGAAARASGLLVPGFIDVPNGTKRHLRRRPGHKPVVVLAVRGRSVADVQDDLVAGVLAANRGSPPHLVSAFLAETGTPSLQVNSAA